MLKGASNATIEALMNQRLGMRAGSAALREDRPLDSPPRLSVRALGQILGPESVTRRQHIGRCAQVVAAIVLGGLTSSLSHELLYFTRLLLLPAVTPALAPPDDTSLAALFVSTENVVCFATLVLEAVFAALPCLGRSVLHSLAELDRIPQFSPALAANITSSLRALSDALPAARAVDRIFVIDSSEAGDVDDRAPITAGAAVNHVLERARDGLAELFEDWAAKHAVPSYNFAAAASAFIKSIDEGSMGGFAFLFCQLLIDKACPSLGADDASTSSLGKRVEASRLMQLSRRISRFSVTVDTHLATRLVFFDLFLRVADGYLLNAHVVAAVLELVARFEAAASSSQADCTSIVVTLRILARFLAGVVFRPLATSHPVTAHEHAQLRSAQRRMWMTEPLDVLGRLERAGAQGCLPMSLAWLCEYLVHVPPPTSLGTPHGRRLTAIVAAAMRCDVVGRMVLDGLLLQIVPSGVVLAHPAADRHRPGAAPRPLAPHRPRAGGGAGRAAAGASMPCYHLLTVRSL